MTIHPVLTHCYIFRTALIFSCYHRFSNAKRRGLAEVIGDSVGDGLGHAVLEGRISEKGGFAAVREVTHFHQNGRAARGYQNVVIRLSHPVTGQARAGHRFL